MERGYGNIQINGEFILINPEEIYRFLLGNEKFINLINMSLEKIKEYFPHSKIYLKFFEDPYDERGNCIFADIFNPYDDFDTNMETCSKLNRDFDFISTYGYFEYYINVIDDDKDYREMIWP